MTFRDAVCALVDALADTSVPWAITASANLALRGFPIEPGDVDVMTDATGTYRIAEAFNEHVVRPIRPPQETAGKHIRSHFGAIELDGIEVELMGDVEHRVDGRWVPAADVAANREFITVAERAVPVMPLDHERRGYRALGRDGRLALIDGGPV